MNKGKNKKFDCVKMKWEIQEKIAQKYKGMSDSEAIGQQRIRITKDPLIGEYIKKLQKISNKYEKEKV